MVTLIQFIARIAPILYGLAAIGIFFSIRGLFQARQARRNAVFGLEREAANERQRRSLSTILSLSLMVGAVYAIANIVVPNLGEPEAEPTSTPVVFVTQQPTATQSLLLYPTVTPTAAVPPAGVSGAAIPTPDPTINGCEILGANISNPAPGQVVSGQVVVEGQANILDFAQYKFEVSGAPTGGVWVVVGTFSSPVPDGYLGSWDSTSLEPGNYTLRLVVLRSNGTYPTPCEVPITIAGPGGGGNTPSGP